jgi:hypothetical protein
MIPKKEKTVVAGLSDEKIFTELEIPQRTQIPPSEELIARLNALASKPPFCYAHKIRRKTLL